MMIQWGKLSRNASRRAIALAAKERGLAYGMLRGHVVVCNGRSRTRYGGGWASVSSRDQCKLSESKEDVRLLLRARGCNTTVGKRFRLEEKGAAQAYAEELEYPVVVKPEGGHKGHGVAKVSSFGEFELAWESLAKEGCQIIVEKFFQAHEYRFTCVKGRVRGVVLRRPASVVGDGVSSVDELIVRKNSLRSSRMAAPPIEVDDVLRSVLRAKSMSLQSVPALGELVVLRDNSNVSMGGEAVDVTADVHPGYVDAINRAAAPFCELLWSGWDVLIKDIKAPPDTDNWCVIEVNGSPMISLHHYPWEGEMRDIAGEGLDVVYRRVPGLGPVVTKRVLIRGPRVQGVGFRRVDKPRSRRSASRRLGAKP